MRSTRPARPWWRVALVAAALVVSGIAPAAADSTPPPQTYPGPSYAAAYTAPPTGGENQNKLWFHADAWWALLVDPTGRSVRVHELMPDHTWRPTSAVVNADAGDAGDALRDGDTVHVVTRGIDSSLLYVNLSFDAAARDYRVGAPVLVTTRNSRSPATIAKDAVGFLWIGYANAMNVVVTRSEDGGLTWGRVTTVATAGGTGTAEVGALVAYDDRVGILWSEQSTGSFRFASHRAGDDPSFWTQEVAKAGPNVADNHVSLSRIPGDAGDRLVAVVKSSHGDVLGNAAAGMIDLLVREPGGQWSTVPVSSIDDGMNDPIVQVDLATRTLRVFATRNGSIVTKTSPLDALAFAPGVGSVFVNGSGRQLSNPTSTKDPVDQRSGLVILASDWHTPTYRHAELSLGPPPADVADQVPPTSPAPLQAEILSSEAVVLSWPPARDGDRWIAAGDGVPVAGYVVSRNGVELATVTATTMEDVVRSEAAGPAVIEYSVSAVDASGNRSAPATVTVELPGPEQTGSLVVIATLLLAVAGMLTGGFFLYRWRLDRASRLPHARQPSWDEPRDRTPVS